MTTQMNDHDVLDDKHRAGCAECTTLWAELEQISADAAKLPPLTPSRDLWPAISDRIAAPVIGSVTPVNAPSRWTVRPAMRIAIAAGLLVAVSSTVTWQIAKQSAPTEVAVSNDLAAGVNDATAEELHLASFQSSVRTMETEISALEKILNERRAELDPRTVKVLEQNLKLIDEAIVESRNALLADPASAFLSAQIARAYTSKITLLRDAATLPTGL